MSWMDISNFTLAFMIGCLLAWDIYFKTKYWQHLREGVIKGIIDELKTHAIVIRGDGEKH